VGRLAVIGYQQETNLLLVEAWRDRGIDAELLDPAEALDRLAPGDVALGRLDVLPTLDGIEPGLQALHWLELVGVRVLNTAASLEAAHDKLLTDERLAAAGVPRPSAEAVDTLDELLELPVPFVVKPRFGSWGRDVFRCRTPHERRAAVAVLATRPWFHKGGAVVEELLDSPGYDLRVLVAGGRVVGSAERSAAPGEWRTNVSLGGSLRHATVTGHVASLATAAAAAAGLDLCGVDVLPGRPGPLVMEVNGAVEFDGRYSLPGGDVYTAVAEALSLQPTGALVG
jgi:[lysine-biosynthesis-protein LysW]---L-2-aminoadipate ligase